MTNDLSLSSKSNANWFAPFLHMADRASLISLKLQGFYSRYVGTKLGPLHLVDAKGKGSLPPILLLHGLGSCAADYLVLIRGLRPMTRRLVAPDMPGHGFSPAPKDGMNPDALRDHVVEALAGILDEPTIIFGNSLGGLVAIRFALAYPEKVKALFLASPGGAPMPKAQLKSFLNGFQFSNHTQALDFVDRFMAKKSWLRPFLAYGVRVRMGQPAIRQMLSQVDEGEMFKPEEIRSLAMPISVFWGKEDRVLPPECREFFRAHLPAHAQFEDAPGYGHAPFMDYPAEFTQKVQKFVLDVATS